MESNSRYNEELFEKFLEIIAPNPHNKINLPEGIKNILFNEDYFKQYAKFEKSYSGSILTYGDITNFQNNYLREKHLLDSDEIKARSLTGKKITIKKDDFNHAFLSDNWGGLNFSQKYTILHWLQSTLSTKPNLPTIDFISTSPNNDGDASYFRNINAIYLKFSNLNSGLFIASALIHEMDHFNCLTNPDINKVIKISDNEINLKNYLTSKYRQIDAIDIDIFQVPQTDRNSVLFLKNILSPIETTKTHNSDVNSFMTFKQYMQNELYIFSPIERKAFAEQSRHLNTMMENQSVKFLDRLILDEINKRSNDVQSLNIAPVLKNLDDDIKNELFNKTMQTNYYLNNDLGTTQSYSKYAIKTNGMLIEIYDYFKGQNGEIIFGEER